MGLLVSVREFMGRSGRFRHRFGSAKMLGLLARPNLARPGEPGERGQHGDDSGVEDQDGREERPPEAGRGVIPDPQGEAESAQRQQHGQETGEPLDQDAPGHRGPAAWRRRGEQEPGRVATDAGRQQVAAKACVVSSWTTLPRTGAGP
jgi:hypothetical protein